MKRFLDWVQSVAITLGAPGLFLIAFLDSSFLSFPEVADLLLVLMVIPLPAPADVIGDEPIWHGDKVVGWVTSGGYAHYVDKSLAQGYVPKEIANDLGKGSFAIEIMGELRKATIIVDPLFDPEGKRMRA